MRFFRFFEKPAKIYDAFFGDLLFVDCKGSSENYFEGKKFFSPTKRAIVVLIEAGADGPTAAQRAFYTQLQRNFDDYTRKMASLVEAAFRNWQADFRIVDFTGEFSLVCLTVPRVETIPLAWDMGFVTEHAQGRYVTIDFRGSEPTGVWIERYA